jgi:hypothetical protein
VIGAYAKEVLAGKLEHLANIIEHLGDLVILPHRFLTKLCNVTGAIPPALVEHRPLMRPFPAKTRTETLQVRPTRRQAAFESNLLGSSISDAFSVGMVDLVSGVGRRAADFRPH